jgi:[ribosomal protein S18]-alanine N-acetyltransferase
MKIERNSDEMCVTVTPLAVDALPFVDAVMRAAFDAQYGEAWNKAQCLGILGLPGYHLRGAWIGGGVSGGASGREGRLAGFSIVRTVVDESELLLLAVAPEWQRRGIGAALMEDWIAMSRNRGVTRVFLEVRAGNGARRLYDQFGLSEIAVRRDYYRGSDGIRYDAVTVSRAV